MFENYVALFMLFTQLWKEGYIEYFTTGLSSISDPAKWYCFEIEYAMADDDYGTERFVYACEDGFEIAYITIAGDLVKKTLSLKEVAEYVIRLWKGESA